MFKLFKRTAQTSEIKQEEQVKTYPTWSVFTTSGRALKQQVAPDFTSNIKNVVKRMTVSLFSSKKDILKYLLIKLLLLRGILQMRDKKQLGST